MSQISGKSKEEVALELLGKLKGVGNWGEKAKDEVLDLYAECLEAASGTRTLDLKLEETRTHVAQTATPQPLPLPN